MMGNHNFPIMGSASNSSDSSQSNSRYYSELPANSQQDSPYSSLRNDKIQQELNQLSKQFNFRYASRDGDDPCIIECGLYFLPCPISLFYLLVSLSLPFATDGNQFPFYFYFNCNYANDEKLNLFYFYFQQLQPTTICLFFLFEFLSTTPII